MTMIERAVSALEAEIQRQADETGAHFVAREGADWIAFDGNLDITLLARAVLLAIREMLDDKADIDRIIVAVLSNCAVSHDGSIGVHRKAVVKALGGVIDAALDNPTE